MKILPISALLIGALFAACGEKKAATPEAAIEERGKKLAETVCKLAQAIDAGKTDEIKALKSNFQSAVFEVHNEQQQAAGAQKDKPRSQYMDEQLKNFKKGLAAGSEKCGVKPQEIDNLFQTGKLRGEAE